MKLAIVTHCLIQSDGQGRVNLEIARECLRLGHDLTLIATEVDPELLKAGARWIHVEPFRRKPELVRVYDFARQADRQIERIRQDVDLIVANGFTLRRKHDVNLSHFVHRAWQQSSGYSYRRGGGARGVYQRLYTRLNCRWERQSYGAAKMIIAISQSMRRELALIGVPADRIRVVPNGVDLQQFHPAQRSLSPEERASLGLPNVGVLGLFVGDLKINRKNLDTVVRAMVTVPDLQIAVVGGTERSAYPELAHALGVAGRVHFLGFRNDVPELMRASDFFVFPSRYDPFGLVVLEALASGLPVITAATTGASDLVTADCGTVLADCEDVAGCAKAMRGLVADAGLRQTMGRNARQVAQRHSWANIVAAYVNIFSSRLGASSQAERLPPLELEPSPAN